jgi:hypothetical protein
LCFEAMQTCVHERKTQMTGHRSLWAGFIICNNLFARSPRESSFVTTATA